mgnify:CR=1 FL=1
MTENTQPPKIRWKGKEYEQSSLTDQQKYLFAQLIDIEKKENSINSLITIQNCRNIMDRLQDRFNMNEDGLLMCKVTNKPL